MGVVKNDRFSFRASEASREIEDLERSREIKRNLTSRQARRLNFPIFHHGLNTNLKRRFYVQ